MYSWKSCDARKSKKIIIYRLSIQSAVRFSEAQWYIAMHTTSVRRTVRSPVRAISSRQNGIKIVKFGESMGAPGYEYIWRHYRAGVVDCWRCPLLSPADLPSLNPSPASRRRSTLPWIGSVWPVPLQEARRRASAFVLNSYKSNLTAADHARTANLFVQRTNRATEDAFAAAAAAADGLMCKAEFPLNATHATYATRQT